MSKRETFLAKTESSSLLSSLIRIGVCVCVWVCFFFVSLSLHYFASTQLTSHTNFSSCWTQSFHTIFCIVIALCQNGFSCVRERERARKKNSNLASYWLRSLFFSTAMQANILLCHSHNCTNENKNFNGESTNSEVDKWTNKRMKWKKKQQQLQSHKGKVDNFFFKDSQFRFSLLLFVMVKKSLSNLIRSNTKLLSKKFLLAFNSAKCTH